MKQVYQLLDQLTPDQQELAFEYLTKKLKNNQLHHKKEHLEICLGLLMKPKWILEMNRLPKT
jgi:hypothetical protein